MIKSAYRCSVCARRAPRKITRVLLGHITRLCLRPECRAIADDRVRISTWRLYYCGPLAIRIGTAWTAGRDRSADGILDEALVDGEA